MSRLYPPRPRVRDLRRHAQLVRLFRPPFGNKDDDDEDTPQLAQLLVRVPE